MLIIRLGQNPFKLPHWLAIKGYLISCFHKCQLKSSVLRWFNDQEEYLTERNYYIKYSKQQQDKYQIYITSGVVEAKLFYIAFKMLGLSLKSQLKMRQQQISYNKIIELGLALVNYIVQFFIQLDQIELVHKVGYVHKDIKPENILFNQTNYQRINYSQVTLIDYGISKEYLDIGGKHIINKKIDHFTGNLYFSNSSRRDDIISLFYLLIYLSRGTLPWIGCITPPLNQEKYNQIISLKEQHFQQAQVNSHNCPLAKLLVKSQGIKFSEDPDYNYLRKKLIQILVVEDQKYHHQRAHTTVDLSNILSQNSKKTEFTCSLNIDIVNVIGWKLLKIVHFPRDLTIVLTKVRIDTLNDCQSCLKIQPIAMSGCLEVKRLKRTSSMKLPIELNNEVDIEQMNQNSALIDDELDYLDIADEEITQDSPISELHEKYIYNSNEISKICSKINKNSMML
ncbi:cg2577-pa [Stylonychia lemnae]|uniref:Casein kinase I n=1 Tax=Stylonychia lemnae TaxID=5949 RepID=A0A077ZTY6_STYLE|nr:cg2577-pa [Stylonychia lemnae]|eukprot:CDW73327.1 cg2577-pa [Stylonychia lemnae]